MNLNFTQIALAIIAACAVAGWIRGPRRALVTTGSIFFAMVLVSLMGADLVQIIKRSGLSFHPSQQADLFLALFFCFTVYVVRLGASRLGSASGGSLTRQQRMSGTLLGLLNGFLLVANVVRYADPYLQSVVNAQTGGWTWHIPLPHISQPHGASVTLSIESSPLTITPSPLLNLYSTLPTALVLLFGFLVFVFVGTAYGRLTHARS